MKKFFLGVGFMISGIFINCADDRLDDGWSHRLPALKIVKLEDAAAKAPAKVPGATPPAQGQQAQSPAQSSQPSTGSKAN